MQLIPETKRHRASISYQSRGSKPLGCKISHHTHHHPQNTHHHTQLQLQKYTHVPCSPCTHAYQSSAHCMDPLNIRYMPNLSFLSSALCLSFNFPQLRGHMAQKPKVRLGPQKLRGKAYYSIQYHSFSVTHVSNSTHGKLPEDVDSYCLLPLLCCNFWIVPKVKICYKDEDHKWIMQFNKL